MEEESNLASEAAMIPQHLMVERNAKGNILTVSTVTPTFAGVSGASFQGARSPVEEESNIASETAMIPHHQTGERIAKGNIMKL